MLVFANKILNNNNIIIIINNYRYIQLYSPECTLADNIDINNNKQNKDRNILITQSNSIYATPSSTS